MSSPDAADSIGPGTIIAGTYKITEILGRGGMGSVWAAEHSRLPGKQVAIKVLHMSVVEDPDSFTRFRREAEIACKLGHPNIVEVHDFNQLDNGCPYLILELLKGESLDMRLRSRGRLDLDTCEHLVRQIASALQCAHEMHVVHRDLKPQNIFLVPSPTGVGPDIVKVLDFGISKIRGSQTIQTQESTLLGTPQYMSPEQATGSHDLVDARTDLFALAAMLYELLSGVPAFGGQNIPEVVYKVVHEDPRPLEELLPELEASKIAAINKALSKDLEDRHSSVVEFVKDFTGKTISSQHARAVNADVQISPMGETIDSSNRQLADTMAQANTVTVNRADVAMAATMDSSNMDRSELLPDEKPTVEPQPTASTSRPTALGKVAVTVIAMCGGAAVAYLALQKDEPTASKPPIVVTETRPAPAIDAMPIPSDASPSDAKSVPDAKPRGNKRAEQPTKKIDAAVPEMLPADVEEKLNQAETLLKQGQHQAAIGKARQANAKRKTARSFVIQAKVYCQMQKLGMVKAALRNLGAADKKRVRQYCKDVGFELL